MSFKSYLDQNYELLKSDCIKSGKLYQDDKFPPNDSSIFRFKNTYGRNIRWKRPHELFKNPEFIVNKIEPNDLDQGQLGNCWVIASAAAILSVPEYIKRVIPLNQSFEKLNYAGIFHFRFWSNGEWIDVVVDDLLPVDENNNLIFCHNNVDRNELFGPLLEKAYAKLNICYEFLNGGLSKDALIDFTGGVNETFNLKRSSQYAPIDRYIDPNKLWNIMFNSYLLKSLMSCSAFVKENQSMESMQKNGIIVGHAYTIIDLYDIYSKNEQFDTIRKLSKETIDSSSTRIRLIKIRNPWGQKISYKGNWSTGTNEWNQLPVKIREILNPNNQIDGQFFMSFEHYIENFDSMETVHVDLNGITDLTGSNDVKINWESNHFKGAWVSGYNSGGSGHDPFLYWTNPQCEIEVKKLNDKEKNSVIISLMQLESAKRRNETDGTYENSLEAIGFRVYSINPGARLNQKSLYEYYDLEEVNRLRSFKIEREVSKRIELRPGKYVILPCTFEFNRNSKFLLRVYTETIESNNRQRKVVNLNIPNQTVKTSCCTLM